MQLFSESAQMNTTASVYDYSINAAAGIQGIVICFGNGLLLLTIIVERSLRSRKEICIVAGLAVADLIVGLGALTLGIYRIFILSSELSGFQMTTAWNCVKLPPVIFANIGGQLTIVMNLIVSVDRYLAVAKPALYRGFGVRYVQLMLGIAGFYGVVSTSMLLLSTYFGKERTSDFTPMCTGWVYPIWYGIFQFSGAAVLGCVSVAIYGAIFIAYRAARRRIGVNRRDDQQGAQQRRLTVTLGIISVFMLIFFVAPTLYISAIAFAGVTTSQPYLMVMFTRVSTIVNISIYIVRQKDIRAGMWKVLTCRFCASRASYTV